MATRSRPPTALSPACAPHQKHCCAWCESAGATASQKPGGYKSWHWIRDTQLNEDKHRYRGNGVLAALLTAAMNLLRLTGFDSIREGMQAVLHDITALLAMARCQPEPNP